MVIDAWGARQLWGPRNPHLDEEGDCTKAAESTRGAAALSGEIHKQPKAAKLCLQDQTPPCLAERPPQRQLLPSRCRLRRPRLALLAWHSGTQPESRFAIGGDALGVNAQVGTWVLDRLRSYVVLPKAKYFYKQTKITLGLAINLL